MVHNRIAALTDDVAQKRSMAIRLALEAEEIEILVVKLRTKAEGT